MTVWDVLWDNERTLAYKEICRICYIQKPWFMYFTLKLVKKRGKFLTLLEIVVTVCDPQKTHSGKLYLTELMKAGFFWGLLHRKSNATHFDCTQGPISKSISVLLIEIFKTKMALTFTIMVLECVLLSPVLCMIVPSPAVLPGCWLHTRDPVSFLVISVFWSVVDYIYCVCANLTTSRTVGVIQESFYGINNTTSYKLMCCVV